MINPLWDAVEALVSAINVRNRTPGHSVDVAYYAVEIAKAIGIVGQALEEIRLAALLHDIGQIIFPDSLIQKQGEPLNEEERKWIYAHTYKGLEFISNWPSLKFAAPFILYHQEWIDGSVYPYGISGEAIPKEVQIVSIADVYEACRKPRPSRNRPGLSHVETIEEMKTMRGKRWSTDLFDLFVSVSKNWE